MTEEQKIPASTSTNGEEGKAGRQNGSGKLVDYSLIMGKVSVHNECKIFKLK